MLRNPGSGAGQVPYDLAPMRRASIPQAAAFEFEKVSFSQPGCGQTGLWRGVGLDSGPRHGSLIGMLGGYTPFGQAPDSWMIHRKTVAMGNLAAQAGGNFPCMDKAAFVVGLQISRETPAAEKAMKER